MLSVGEIIKERHQGRRQRRRAVEPRIDRHGSYVLLRAVTNVLLRDLNAGLIVEQMMSGTPSVFCDFTDYDEIAHHAGPTRPESLASLEGLDHLIGVLERAAQQAPRPYEFVVLSDHGQSQGATFRQRHGQSLEELIRELVAGGRATVTAATNLAETAGPANTLLSQVGEQGGAYRQSGPADDARPVGGQRGAPGGRDGDPGPAAADVLPCGLRCGRDRGHRVGKPRDGLLHPLPGQDDPAEIDAAYPGLVSSLVAHAG